MKNTKSIFFLVIVIFLFSCKEEDKETEADTALFDEITSITDYHFYQDDATILPSSDESPHNDYFRVKFNSTAHTMLTDDGKLPTDATFPNNSIIIKELYNEPDGELVLYAVMKKADDANTAGGWLWAEFKPDGSTFHSISEQGNGCIACHSINERDHVRLFDLFP